MTDFAELVEALRLMEAEEQATQERNRAIYYDALSGRHEGTMLVPGDPVIAAAEAARVKEQFRARHAALKSEKNT